MTARAWMPLLATLAAVTLGAPATRADDELAATLRGVVERNIAAYDREDVEATLATVDSRSPAYDVTRQTIETLFPALDLDSELVDFRYIGHDDEFAVARVRTRTVAEGDSDGGTFEDNTVDAIVLFHQENGEWKLWDEEVLGVETAD